MRGASRSAGSLVLALVALLAAALWAWAGSAAAGLGGPAGHGHAAPGSRAAMSAEGRRPAGRRSQAGDSCAPAALLYHDVLPDAQDRGPLQRDGAIVSASQFREEMAWLARSGRPVETVRQFLAAPEPCAVLITFDDGYPGIATQALPVLEQYHLCATLFLIGNTVGRPGYLSAAQLQRLVDSGLFDIEGHTFAGHDAAPGHPAFSEMTPPEFQRDQELEVALFRRFHIPAPVAIAYPHGRPNLRLVPLLARDGYRVGFTVVPGWISPHDNPWLLPRWIVWPRMPLHRFAAILTHHGRA